MMNVCIDKFGNRIVSSEKYSEQIFKTAKKKCIYLNVTEKVIAKIFLTTDKSILFLRRGPLRYNHISDLSQIARQKKFDNRRINGHALSFQNELLLIELKAVPFYHDIILRINELTEFFCLFQ